MTKKWRGCAFRINTSINKTLIKAILIVYLNKWNNLIKLWKLASVKLLIFFVVQVANYWQQRATKKKQSVLDLFKTQIDKYYIIVMSSFQKTLVMFSIIHTLTTTKKSTHLILWKNIVIHCHNNITATRNKKKALEKKKFPPICFSFQLTTRFRTNEIFCFDWERRS